MWYLLKIFFGIPIMSPYMEYLYSKRMGRLIYSQKRPVVKKQIMNDVELNESMTAEQFADYLKAHPDMIKKIRVNNAVL